MTVPFTWEPKESQPEKLNHGLKSAMERMKTDNSDLISKSPITRPIFKPKKSISLPVDEFHPSFRFLSFFITWYFA